MALSDSRSSVLSIINEVRRKLGVPNDASSLASDDQSIVLIDMLNDVVTEINDFGLWNEMISTQTITFIDGQNDYSLAPSIPVKTIKDIFTSQSNSVMAFIDQEDMRLLLKNNPSVQGQPRQWTVFGTDANANPIVRVYPAPDSTAAGTTADVFYQKANSIYTTSDGAEIVPFPARLVVQGLLAYAILDENDGAPSDQYTLQREKFMRMMNDTFNRFKADVGYSRRFTPSTKWRR